MIIAKIHSTLFRAKKTNRPIPKPKGTVMPGARNFSQASMKLIAQTNPIQRKTLAMTRGYLIMVFGLKIRFYVRKFWPLTDLDS